MKTITTVFLAFVLVGHTVVSWGNDQLYRCADGTYTNRVELNCTPHELKTTGRIQAGTPDGSKSVKAHDQKQSFAEVNADEETRRNRLGRR